MRIFTTLLFILTAITIYGQQAQIKGVLQDDKSQPVVFANVALYNSKDSTLVKVETSDDSGVFRIKGLNAGNYFISATYIGLSDLNKRSIELETDEQLDLGILSFSTKGLDLEEVTVTTSRAMVEVKPDRTVFNVEGTINSVGSDAISLLRKAPGVTVDNNDNINVLGRAGVLVYIDGKRLPLAGDDLSNYLQNLPAEQIDRIDIITNPGAKYEAEGNAGIIDIRLKRDKNMGTNGSLSSSFSKGELFRYNVSGTANYRNKKVNIFGNVGYGDRNSFNRMFFESYQNGIRRDETDNTERDWNNINYRVGTDFFLSKKHTIGFLVGGRFAEGNVGGTNRISIRDQVTPLVVDSVLIAENTSSSERDQNTFNLNYRFDISKGKSLNIDLDYGKYKNDSDRFQPNLYYDASETTVLTENINSFNTPTDIDIYTFKVDYEDEVWGGKLGLGTKLSRVESDNTFLVFDQENGVTTQNNSRSNIFDYDENVYAGYINFARPINKKVSFSAGLRAEQTDAVGNLTTFIAGTSEPPVKLNYLSLFPSAGLTFQLNRSNTLSLRYGRRINRPDYNVLNPFNIQWSELSYEKGNPGLRPEIVNNVEIGYTYAYRYNFKLAYSKTKDQITRLIGPDDIDPRSNFITWANLSNQTIFSFNLSAPFQITPKWNAFFNFSASHQNNQADYGNGAVVDVQAFTYSIFQQQTFTLPKGFKAEVSGYFAGPGIWGGVFEYETSWSLNLGLQKKFLQDKLNVKLSASDIFFESGWDGVSKFDGLVSYGSGRNDSRRVTLSLSYRFGNQNVKSRKRKSGLEDEADRLGG